MTTDQLFTCVQHCERTGRFRISQDALVTRHEPRASVARGCHQNAVGWISMRITREARASNSYAWRELDDLYSRNVRGLLDPLEWLRRESNPVPLGEHCYFPHRNG